MNPRTRIRAMTLIAVLVVIVVASAQLKAATVNALKGEAEDSHYVGCYPVQGIIFYW